MVNQNRPEPVPVDPEPIPVDPEPIPIDPETGEPIEDTDDDIILEISVPKPVEEEPISLVEDANFTGESKVRNRIRGALEKEKAEYKRPLNLTGTGATRCRMFHSRVSIIPMEYMQGAINDWIDAEGIEVKHVDTLIGVMEGKTPEPNLIVIVWY